MFKFVKYENCGQLARNILTCHNLSEMRFDGKCEMESPIGGLWEMEADTCQHHWSVNQDHRPNYLTLTPPYLTVSRYPRPSLTKFLTVLM